jgi:hypothetical protein
LITCEYSICKAIDLSFICLPLTENKRKLSRGTIMHIIFSLYKFKSIKRPELSLLLEHLIGSHSGFGNASQWQAIWCNETWWRGE